MMIDTNEKLGDVYSLQFVLKLMMMFCATPSLFTLWVRFGGSHYCIECEKNILKIENLFAKNTIPIIPN